MNQLIVDREIDQGDGDVGIIQTAAFVQMSVPKKLNGQKHRQLNRSKNLMERRSNIVKQLDR